MKTVWVLLKLGHLLVDLCSCCCYYNSLQCRCFQCFPIPCWRRWLEEGTRNSEQQLEEEAEIGKGEHTDFGRGKDVVVEGNFVEEQENSKEYVRDVKGKLVEEQQEHAKEDVEEPIVRALYGGCCAGVT